LKRTTVRPSRLVLATLCAIGVLVLAPRGATPGSAGWLGLVTGPAAVAAASPEPSAPGGDTRSAGEGPGLVGAPFLAIVGIVALGLAAAVATLLYLRLTVGPGGGRTGAGDGPGKVPPKHRG
jgi:hypothetical protein